MMSFAELKLTGTVAHLAEIAKGVEEDHHRIGWDNMPVTLYAITRDPEIPEGQEFSFALSPARLGQYDEPREELAHMASVTNVLAEMPSMIDEESLRHFRNVYRQPLAAHMLVMEAWQHFVSDATTEEEATAQFEGRSLADIPGSVEVRMATLVTDGHQIIVSRQRGKEPVFAHIDLSDEEEATSFSGGMMRSLTALHESTIMLIKAVIG
jgi:hypothetical protein